MSAPIRFHGFDGNRNLLVLVGKSPELRPVQITRTQAAQIIAALARTLAETSPTETETRR